MILELCYLAAGKYLNNYGLKASGVGLDHIPPGWTTWFTLQGNRWETHRSKCSDMCSDWWIILKVGTKRLEMRNKNGSEKNRNRKWLWEPTNWLILGPEHWTIMCMCIQSRSPHIHDRQNEVVKCTIIMKGKFLLLGILSILVGYFRQGLIVMSLLTWIPTIYQFSVS